MPNLIEKNIDWFSASLIFLKLSFGLLRTHFRHLT
jgi:hypothetical protein